MQFKPITRRRALTIVTGAIASIATIKVDDLIDAIDFEWRGTAMGTDARILFYGAGYQTAEKAVAMAVAEIERLELALSLFRAESEICRLNRQGFLRAPSADLRRALALALAAAEASDGLFDPTVQSLWECYVDWFGLWHEAEMPPQAMVAKALETVDWRKIDMTTNIIRLGAKQRLTLNGLGQGYVTDRIADLLRDNGFNHVLVDLGEQRALGPNRSGKPWLISRIGQSGIELTGGALATSEGSGCILGAAGAAHHLFDPRNGRSPQHWRRVSVHHASAAVADALSTAFYAASTSEIEQIHGKFQGLMVWATARDGTEQCWTSPSATAANASV